MKHVQDREVQEHIQTKGAIMTRVTAKTSCRTKLQEQELGIDSEKYDKFKRDLRSLPYHFSSDTVNLKKTEMKALKAGAFAQKEMITRAIVESTKEDEMRHEAEIARRLKVTDYNIQRAQKQTRIRMQQKNKAMENAEERHWEHELHRLQQRNKNSSSKETRRHEIACKMLCGELNDTGMHRMRSYGKRYKLAKDGNLWSNLPSLTKTHVFSKADENASERMIKTQRRGMLRRSMPRLGTAMTVASDLSNDGFQTVDLHKTKGSRRGSQRSKTSMM